MRNAGRPFTRPLRNTLACASVLAIASTGCNSTQERTVPTDPVASQADEESSSTTAPLVAGPVAAQDADAQLRQDAAKLSLQMQKRASLVEGNLARAQDFVDRLMFEAAEREAMQALDLDPENVEAKQLLTEIRAMLGRPLDQTQTLAETLSTEYGLRVQQLKADAQDNLNSGRQALARGEYDKAISELSLVLNSVRWAPYAIDWDGIETEAQALMTQAEAERDAAVVAQREAAQREAHQAIQQREDAERARREAVMANILEQAIDAFDAADYDRAIDLADEALRLDARNDRALELRDAAFRAGRAKVRSDYIDDKREEFARWREHLQELEIPWTDTITYPDREDWRELTERRSSREGFDLSSYVSVSEAELRRQMSTRTVILPGIQDEESLRAVVDIIRNFTGMALVVDTAAENVVLDEGIIFDLNIENPLTVTQALNLITDIAGEDVTWTVRHDTVLVTTREKARGEPVIVNHDVQDLILGLTDFTGPRIDRLRLLDELEDEDGGGPFGGILDKPSLIEVDDLVVLIQDNVGVGTWDEEGVSIESGEGFILIVHSADVQAQVREFLEDLRRFNSSLVTIESRFMTVADNWIQELGVDFRGLDNINVTDVTNGLEDMASRGLDNGGTGSAGQGAAGPPSAGFFFDDGQDGDFRGTTQNFFGDNLGNALSTVGGLSFQLTFLNDLQLSTILRAVEKSSQFELINSQMLSVHNTQRAYVTVINQQAYIQDFDVEVAQFQAVADPQVNVLHEGVVLDVRPTIHQDRRYLTLEIQPTVARIVALRDFSTTLAGQTAPVSFQLPELEVQSVNTSAIIPDGGSILLGGLSNIRNIERRAEVPWLARIPVLGFLFKQEGYSDERDSLMILIRARIIDVRESVQRRLEAGF